MNTRSLVLILTTIIIIASCNSLRKNEGSADANLRRVIEAEEMNLEGYEIEKTEALNYIKLTGSTGIARFNFPLPSGSYDIDASYLSESAGQNSYVMYIAGNQIVAWLGKDRDDQWHKLSEQRWHTPRSIDINNGDEIRIEALSETGSMVVLDYIEFNESGRLGSPALPTQATQASATVETVQKTKIQVEGLVTIHPAEYETAIKNPLKGFRPKLIYSSADDKLAHEYGTLIKMYFKWNELENSAGDDVNKIREVCDRKWSGFEEKNVKVIPRVELERPGRNSGWPDDMTTGDYTSDQFKQRVIALIRKLGQAWDNDSRVAYIEMGLIGQWGEMEWPDTKDEIKEAMAAQFNESFKNKLVMIRWPFTYNDQKFNFGYYWDSFAHIDQDYCGFHINRTAPRWKTAVIGGETAYNWGRVNIQPGRNPDESLKKPVHRDYIINQIRKLHANHLGWIADYDQTNDTVRAGAMMLQKAMGYRFVISEVSYTGNTDPGSGLMVSFKVKNTGSSPFYYNWPVEVSLLDPVTKLPVWKQQCANLDIRSWLPGDQWDDMADSYAIPAETYRVDQTFSLTGIPSGEYILALAILDPAGNRPCVRFAIKNYYKGGRHPIGMIGVDRQPDTYSVTGFDDIQSDESLFYDRVN